MESSNFYTHRSKTNGFAERAVRRIKEGTFASGVASRLGRKMVGGFHGMLLLSAERTRLFWDGKTPFERRCGEPFKGTVIPCGSIVEIIRSMPKTSQDSNNLVRKFCLESSLGMHCMRRVSGKETSWSQTVRNLKIWPRQKFMLGDSVRKRSSCRKVVTFSHSRSQMDQSSCREEIRFSEDPPQSRIAHPLGTDDSEVRNDFLDDRRELYLS